MLTTYGFQRITLLRAREPLSAQRCWRRRRLRNDAIKLATARGLGYTGSAEGLRDPETNLTYVRNISPAPIALPTAIRTGRSPITPAAITMSSIRECCHPIGGCCGTQTGRRVCH